MQAAGNKESNLPIAFFAAALRKGSGFRETLRTAPQYQYKNACINRECS